MLAFHSKQEIKDKYLARVKQHREADDIIKGKYWVNQGGIWRGCAVGCTLHSDDHAAYETELGIPQIIARLEDRIFEGLPEPLHLDWPLRFLDAIAVGADLRLVWPKFIVWLLRDPERGTMRLCRPEGVAATKVVIALYERKIAGDEPSRNEWLKARDQAMSARLNAYAAYAAYAAAYAAADAARSKHYVAMSEKLLELLSIAK